MTHFYKDYGWKEGVPYGIQKTDQEPSGITYRVLSDPYRKRMSIEKYREGQWESVIYDSALLNFRTLTPANQTAWQKALFTEEADVSVWLIRDQDDRVVCLETYFFEGPYCVLCESRSPQGILLSTQKMYYTALHHSFNGVVLYDAAGKAVMRKVYACDEDSGEFTELLEETWDLNR